MEGYEPQTFKELYSDIQTIQNIEEWLNDAWVGKDKLESCLRLFSNLGIICKLQKFNICNGNFNKQTIKTIKHKKEIFYNRMDELRKLKDKGDASDLTGIHKDDSKTLLVTTSKNINQLNIGKLDITQILYNFSPYEASGYSLILCIVIRDKVEFMKMLENVEKSNQKLKDMVEHETTILLDYTDIYEAYNKFIQIYKDIKFEDLIKCKKEPLVLKMHQRLGVLKTLRLKQNDENNILWGQIQRSGKSYIMAGCMIDDSKNKQNCNYLIMTTAPNETIEQYIDVLNCLQLEDYTIIYLNNKTKDIELTSKKNIIICSKQFLGNKTGDRTIKWLKKLKIDMKFLDESHFGGATDLAKNILNIYGNKCFTIHITATYTKPTTNYNIPRKNWILWDLEDIKYCKNINEGDNEELLIMKHGEELRYILKEYSRNNIIDEYSKYPELFVLIDEISPETIEEIIKLTKNNNYGYSLDAIFLLSQGVIYNEDGTETIEYHTQFQDEGEVLKLFYRIFGKYNKYGISDTNYPDEKVFMKRIDMICNNTQTESRYIGNMTEPMIIMCYLPMNHISIISKALIKLLNKVGILSTYELIDINCEVSSGKSKQRIEEARQRATLTGKIGVLVFSGGQCTLGVTIDNCDIVILLNTNMGYDKIYQMMFRSMTEGNNKRNGFVIDLDITRELNIMTEYSIILKPEISVKQSLKYLLRNRIINLNGDYWMPCFGNKNYKFNELIDNIYSIYSSNFGKAIDHLLNRLKMKEVILMKEDQYKLNMHFYSNKDAVKNDKKIKKGIDKIIVNNNTTDEQTTKLEECEDKNYTNINYSDIIRHIIPLLCILTINSEIFTFEEMNETVEQNEDIQNILINQLQSWWGKKIDIILYTNLIINKYSIYMDDDNETKQLIKTIKELFIENKNNTEELSKLVDKYLIPQELEKKTNAEVSTPYKLRQEMLEKMPTRFWRKPRKVFEPCSGKGGFLIDIVNYFMVGLKETIKDEDERYRVIVEECLYFSDINPTNIFICKLLLDSDNKYNLNSNEGNTLELDITERWGIDGFDAVIGNPPYNSSGNTGTGNTIWQHFTKKSLNIWLNNKGYLIFVHPSGWRKPNTERGKYYGLYELMTNSNRMIYLSIHGIKDGFKMFRCGTRYDWYIIEKKINNSKTTIINDEDNNNYILDLNNFKWLPNSNILEIQKLLTVNEEDRCGIIYNRSNYGSDKKYISKIQTEEYKYPIIHTIPKTGVRYIYSNTRNKGHFGVPKIIFGDNGLNDVVIDILGLYGMSENSMGIIIDNIEHGNNIKKALLSTKFKNILKNCIFGNFRIDWRLFTYFKADFWKEFI
jgi:hypothetical protein